MKIISFHNIFTILTKDLIDVTKSKAVLFSLSVPIILSLFFSMAFSSPQHISIGVCDNGSQGFIRFLEKTGYFNIKNIKNEDDGRKMLSSGKISGVIILPDNFDRQIFSREKPSVKIFVDDLSSAQSQSFLPWLSEIFRIYSGQAIPVNLKIEKIKNSKLGFKQQMLPLWILLTVMGGIVVTTSSLMEEKEKKTLHALLVSPASMYDVVIGKGLLGVVLVLISSLLLLLLNGGLTGNLIFLISLLLCGAICFSLWGIFVALVAPGQTTANSINSMVFIVLMIPIALSQNSSVLMKVSKFLPSYYLVDGITKTMEGTWSSGILLNYLVLIICSFVLFFSCLKIINSYEN